MVVRGHEPTGFLHLVDGTLVSFLRLPLALSNFAQQFALPAFPQLVEVYVLGVAVVIWTHLPEHV